MKAYIFGNGHSIDDIDYEALLVMGALSNSAITVGINRAPLLNAFRDTRFIPTHYVAIDRYKPQPIYQETAEALKKWHGIKKYLIGDWPGNESEDFDFWYTPNSCMWAAQAAAYLWGCDEVALVGIDCWGPYARFKGTPDKKNPWLDPDYQNLVVNIWRNVLRNMDGVKFSVWPKSSLLYGEVIRDYEEI